MDDISTHIDAEVSPDSPRLGLKGLCFPEHLSSRGNHVGSLPNHGDDRPTGHILHEFGEEGKMWEILIVLLKELFSWANELQGD